MTTNVTIKSLSTTDDAFNSITIKQGTSFALAIAPKDVDGVAIDTSTYSLSGTFRTAFANDKISHYDAAAVLVFSETEGNVFNDTLNNYFLVSFTAADTTALKFKGETLEGVYDFELTAPDASKSRPLYGTWTLLREVTTV
jgi:hypothetical protein